MAGSITLHEIAAAELPEQTEEIAGRERDTFQCGIDKLMLDLKTETAKAGWPAHDPKKLFRRLVVGKDDVTALKQVIRRSGTLLHVEPAFYKSATTEAGHVVVKWHADRKLDAKTSKPVTDPMLEESGKLIPAKVTEAEKAIAAANTVAEAREANAE